MNLYVKFICLAAFCAVLASCAKKSPVESQPESLELDFRPLVLRWHTESPEAENSPAKDSCVIQITAALMHHPLILKSEAVELEYMVLYDKNGEKLVFEGFVADKMLTGRPESHWTTTCGGGQNVVVNFHNGQ